MGHVRGGYRTILDAVEKRLAELGVLVHTGTAVAAVSPTSKGATKINVHTQKSEESFDKVLLTVPAPDILRLTGRAASDGAYWKSLADVKYLGVICLLVVLDRRVSPYYVTNLLDKSLPFTGIIEATNIVDPAELGGRHLVYLPKYVVADDPLFAESDEAITTMLLDGLRKVHPEVPVEAIIHTRLFRERYVQPLQEVNYLDRTRGIQTPVPGVYLANSTMLYNSTLNNNAVISLADRAVAIMTEGPENA
jgi:protoporphyrinogen oxidase